MLCVASYVSGALPAIFLHSESPCPDARSCYERKTNEDKYFSAIQVIDGSAIEIWIGEDAVYEDENRRRVDEKVQQLPIAPHEFLPVVRRGQDDGKDIGGDCADGIFKGLQGWMYRDEDVVQPKAVSVYEEKNQRMNDDRREENVGGPVMNGEDVEAAVGPESNGAVTDRDQKPKQNVGRRKEHRNQAYISTHVNQRDQIPPSSLEHLKWRGQ